ncbi:hypothetical protein ACWGCP_36855, partial [Streptomyces niveus]
MDEILLGLLVVPDECDSLSVTGIGEEPDRRGASGEFVRKHRSGMLLVRGVEHDHSRGRRDVGHEEFPGAHDGEDDAVDLTVEYGP